MSRKESSAAREGAKLGTLEGCVAFVSGGSRGIGKGCALELGAAGATVLITGRSVEPKPGAAGSIHQTAEEVTALGGKGIALRCDHRDDAQVEEAFARVRSDHGRLDVLVNSAFIVSKELTSGRSFWRCPISNWDDMVTVGTRGAYITSWHAAQLMSEAGSGLIANISSSGAAEYAWHVAYGVGKAALDRLTADVGKELAPEGVTCVSIWPGLVLTERNEAAQESIPGLDFSKAESPRFSGRAIVALATDPNRLSMTGEAHTARDLAEHYGFRDVDGRLPPGPLHNRGADAASD